MLPESCCVSVLHQHTNLRFVKAQWRIGQMNCGTTVMECYVATKKKEDWKKIRSGRGGGGGKNDIAFSWCWKMPMKYSPSKKKTSYRTVYLIIRSESKTQTKNNNFHRMGDIWFASHLIRDLYPEYIKNSCGTSLVVQWLRLCASPIGVAGSIPGQGTKIPHAVQHGPKRKKTTMTKQNRIYKELL